jgi:hypothetical protein
MIMLTLLLGSDLKTEVFIRLYVTAIDSLSKKLSEGSKAHKDYYEKISVDVGFP